MRALGAIAAAFLLTAAVASAEEPSGEKLVHKLFADCDAALADPASVLKLGPITGENPAMATTDGKVVNATMVLSGADGAFFGTAFINAVKLPGGTSANCMVTLQGGAISEGLQTEMLQVASDQARKLIGDNIVTVGGLVGGPALLMAPSNGMTQINLLASSDFPPSTRVTISVSSRFANVSLERFQAAP